MTEEEYRNDWNRRGFSFDITTIELHKGVDKASHEDMDELVVVVNGDLEFTVDNKQFIAECDSEVYIPARAIHSIQNRGCDAATIYYGYKSVS